MSAENGGAGAEAPGRIQKVMTFDAEGQEVGEWSTQLPSDPFANGYQYAGIQEPPFSLEQLIFLAEQHPTHAAVLEQKAADVVGKGWTWESDKEEQGEDDSQRKKLDEWFNSLAEDDETDQSTHEILLSAISDMETVGHGLIELAREKTNDAKLRHWFHLPAHTTRFHRDGLRVAQIRQGKRVWFKRWIPGDDREVNKVTGAVTKGKGSAKDGQRANEVFVLRRPSRRSSWYGIPTYIPATGWITLSTAARDDNIYYFENRREPRWAVVLENVEDDPDLERKLRQAFSVDLKKPHRNIVIPIAGKGKVNFQQLGDNKGDMSWERMQDRADQFILIAHRMPGERIGLVRTGALGGTTVEQSTRVYKESYVQTTQALLETRVNKLIAAESGVENPQWRWKCEELDLTESGAELDTAVRGFQGGVYLMKEARDSLGLEPLEDGDERADKFFFELAPLAAAAAAGQNFDQGQLDAANSKLADEISALVGGQGGEPAPAPAEDDSKVPTAPPEAP